MTSNIRSTVIVKTDICGYTTRVKTLSDTELSALLDQHKGFISSIVARNSGSIIKGEGDSFWIIFPSVTTAALAALEMHAELRQMQSGKSDEERLAIRVVITLGDVLHQDHDIFGDTVNLTARIEGVTPPDDIYLSQSAWLALNKAEIRSAYVNEFILKGFKEPVKVYKIEQQHKTRVIQNQILVATDIAGFTRFYQTHTIAETEDLLVFLDESIKQVCEAHGGVIRLILGDGYFLSFPEALFALEAVEQFAQRWIEFMREKNINCGQHIGIHKGDFNIFRSCLYGPDVNLTFGLLEISTSNKRSDVNILVNGKVRKEIIGTNWEMRLKQVFAEPLQEKSQPRLAEFIRDNGLFEMVLG